jgi:NTP pyrophosphatase (non-canonical NTP hydrolase)
MAKQSITKEDSLVIFQRAVARLKKERDWDQFHQPKDLLLGLIEEIGEFRNLVKWEQDPKKIRDILVTKATPEHRAEVVDFFGDALWYLGSLADYCKVDLIEASQLIITELDSRFPKQTVKGTTANPKTGGYDGKYSHKKKASK